LQDKNSTVNNCLSTPSNKIQPS